MNLLCSLDTIETHGWLDFSQQSLQKTCRLVSTKNAKEK